MLPLLESFCSCGVSDLSALEGEHRLLEDDLVLDLEHEADFDLECDVRDECCLERDLECPVEPDVQRCSDSSVLLGGLLLLNLDRHPPGSLERDLLLSLARDLLPLVSLEHELL